MPMCTITGTTDALGTVTVTCPEYYEGRLQNIYVEYDPASPAGTDVTLYGVMEGVTPVVLPYLIVLNNNTDTMFFPRATCCDAAAALIFYDLTAPAPGARNQGEVSDCFYVHNQLRLAVAQGGAGNIITARFYFSDFK